MHMSQTAPWHMHVPRWTICVWSSFHLRLDRPRVELLEPHAGPVERLAAPVPQPPDGRVGGAAAARDVAIPHADAAQFPHHALELLDAARHDGFIAWAMIPV